MADDAISAINKAETFGILALIVVIGYALYKAGGAFTDFMDQLTGASAGNTYTNAASQIVQHPIASLGSIVGMGQGSSGGQSELPSDLSAVGYMKIGASGQHWSCTGPQGASNDTCMAVTVDGSGNATLTGAPGVPAAQAN